MNFLTQIIAALGLLACVALALRMALPARLRQRLDSQARRAWYTATAWRRQQVIRKTAAAQAEAAIQRARASASKPEGEWDGNVYRPKRFDKRKDKRNLH